MYKIVIINQIFGVPRNRIRWKMLADAHPDLDVTLIAPRKRVTGGTGNKSDGVVSVVEWEKSDCGNYHLWPVKCKFDRKGGWTSDEMIKIIDDLSPHLVYHIGSHFQPSLHQCLKHVSRKLPQTKMALFSMRGPNNNMFYHGKTSLIKRIGRVVLFYPKILNVNRYADAVLCHYPDALKAFRDEWYKGPIYISTQNGVNTDIFRPNQESRKEIRVKYNLNDSFVLGSVARFTPEKGWDDVIDALPADGNWKYMVIGGGSEEEKKHLQEHIDQRGFKDRFIFVGFLEWEELAKYLNAMDCAIHVPRTGTWTETMSVALLQEMATGLPVIGSNSGSVPYQIGPEGMIVEERDPVILGKKVEWVLSHKEEAETIGKKMLWRAEHCFSIKHLTDCIYDIFIDIIHGVFDEKKTDMTKYKVYI